MGANELRLYLVAIQPRGVHFLAEKTKDGCVPAIVSTQNLPTWALDAARSMILQGTPVFGISTNVKCWHLDRNHGDEPVNYDDAYKAVGGDYGRMVFCEGHCIATIELYLAHFERQMPLRQMMLNGTLVIISELATPPVSNSSLN